MKNHLPPKNLKIALIGYHLANGGLEKVMATVSTMLHTEVEVAKLDVILLEDKIGYSYNGNLIELGKFHKISKYFKLKKLLITNQYDYVLDFRYRINPIMEFIFFNFIYSNQKVITNIHSAALSTYLTKRKWIGKLVLRKSYKVVAVSGYIKNEIQKLFDYTAVTVIHNSFSRQEVEEKVTFTSPELDFQYILAAGRLIPLKQFDQLIECYVKTKSIEHNIHLVIIGKGDEELKLKQKIASHKMEKWIHLLGFVENPFPYYKNAKFLVLSSKYEGFPMNILESLASGTPVISFDCNSGPSEMIKDEFNGLLVDNQNFEALTNKINIFVENETVYNSCKKNAKESVTHFEIQQVKKEWLKVLQ